MGCVPGPSKQSWLAINNQLGFSFFSPDQELTGGEFQLVLLHCASPQGADRE